jgi:hypothetical protein
VKGTKGRESERIGVSLSPRQVKHLQADAVSDLIRDLAEEIRTALELLQLCGEGGERRKRKRREGN